MRLSTRVFHSVVSLACLIEAASYSEIVASNTALEEQTFQADDDAMQVTVLNGALKGKVRRLKAIPSRATKQMLIFAEDRLLRRT